jgi:hypothetical protein
MGGWMDGWTAGWVDRWIKTIKSRMVRNPSHTHKKKKKKKRKENQGHFRPLDGSKIFIFVTWLPLPMGINLKALVTVFTGT